MTRSLLSLVVSCLLALSLAACARDGGAQTSSHQVPQELTPTTPAPAPEPTDPVPAETDGSAMACDAAPAQGFVGKRADEATIAAARDAAGATGDLRVIKPGQPVTMDFRHDRLNVEVDDHDMIVRIHCG